MIFENEFIFGMLFGFFAIWIIFEKFIQIRNRFFRNLIRLLFRLQCLCCILATAFARPEAGYSYPSPNVPFHSNSVLSSGSSGHHYTSGGLTSSYSLGLLGGGGGGGISHGGISHGGVSSLLHSGITGGVNSNFDYSSGYASGNFGGSSGGGYAVISGRPTIHKHVYVHVAPPEQDNNLVRKPIVVPGPQKHYKIVFIKAPVAPSPAAAVVPQTPQNEEKTLIYVLHKNPDEQPDIVVPTAAPTAPSKPEVFFIKYKTRREGGNIGTTGGVGGISSEGGSTGVLGGASLSGFDDNTLSGLGSLDGNVGGTHGAGGVHGSISGSGFGTVDDNTSSKYGPPGLVPGKPHH